MANCYYCFVIFAYGGYAEIYFAGIIFPAVIVHLQFMMFWAERVICELTYLEKVLIMEDKESRRYVLKLHCRRREFDIFGL